MDQEFYVPDHDGLSAFLTPLMVENFDTPETTCVAQAIRFGEPVDLVAWDPRHPHSWALRYGAAGWRGACCPQHLDPPTVAIHQGVLEWLQSGCRGLVLLSWNPVNRYRVLSHLQHIEAEDATHAAGLARIIAWPWHGPPAEDHTTAGGGHAALRPLILRQQIAGRRLSPERGRAANRPRNNRCQPNRANQPNKGMAVASFATTCSNGLMSMIFEPLRRSIPGYVPRGLSILAGRQKLGKTWPAIDSAVAVATGGRWAIPMRAADVLCIDLENGLCRIRRRLLTLCQDEQPGPI